MTHQWVDVHDMERLHTKVTLKLRAHRDEEGMHVRKAVIISMVAHYKQNVKAWVYSHISSRAHLTSQLPEIPDN